MPRGVLIAVLITLAGVMALATAGSARSAYPGKNGRIAFVSDRDGDFEIYTVLPNGKGLRTLTNNRVADRYPAWSPDGRWLAFTRHRPWHTEVYVMRADGSGVRRIARSPGHDYSPSWSPNGRRIAFMRDYLPDDPKRQLHGAVFTIGLDGRKLRRVTKPHLGFESAEWGPSNRIVWLVHGNPNDLKTLRPDGTDERWVHLSAGARYPTWSPDGRRIAFIGVGWESDLYTVSWDGTDAHRLTTTFTSHPLWPAYSPDGRKIVFTWRGGDLWTISPDGSGLRRLLRFRGTALEADWGPAR